MIEGRSRWSGRALVVSLLTIAVFATSGALAGAGDTSDNDGDGFSIMQGDCDDTNFSIYPGAIDQPEDTIDQDCLGGDAQYIQTVIDKGPSGKTTKRRPKFEYHAEGGSSGLNHFECRVDGQGIDGFESCPAGGKKLPRLSLGKHKFEVRAIDNNGFADPDATVRRFRVVRD